MATLRELKGRISSVSSSEKITGAMKMISSAKMHKAEGALRRLVPFRSQIELILTHLLSTDAEFTSPLTETREVKKIALVVFGSDDGLCGGYNIQMFKNLLIVLDDIKNKYGKDIKIQIIPVGKKIQGAVKKLNADNIEVITHYSINTRSNLDQIRAFTDILKEKYITKEVDKIQVLYTHFKSVSKQMIQLDNLLPLSCDNIIKDKKKIRMNQPYIFEPDANAIFNVVIPLYILSAMQEMSAENNASEQAARVMAMQSANDNAKNLLDDLQIIYNKLRQQGITTELLDIIGGQTQK